jgi:hypothetical protein
MDINDKIRIRSWAKLKYYDPAKILREFRKIEQQIVDAPMDEDIKTLRTSKLRKHKQGREAALLCHGIGAAVLGTTVFLSPSEDSDYDFVAMWRTEGFERYAPVQLKEWVPDHINPYANLNDLISGLHKYKSSRDTIVGIYSNRAGTFKFSDIIVPKLNLSGLWIFGSITPNHLKWFIYGNIFQHAQYYEFMYPA